uniref:SEC7 domain-containing protein n=1 Tax=Alexandrium catenella TaxID=2925 RepID=A0A7S1Q5N7_ALECA|mmetsp:Transcript_17434/g.47382  ORF Transcript_17434/g.47382 Transcript_17434/m.47382 type:complete len:486 (+) Transcript_17434:2-1459(+)
MSTFLRRSKVDIKQVGAFLGEAFSLSHTIRLEFINSVVLQNTGVVSALIQVFHMLQLPDDLQKINRLVHGVARIWWRQHERMLKDAIGNAGQRKPPQRPGAVGPPGGPQLHLDEELTGLELKSYLTSSDALHQIMFSTVMLHWYMYKDGSGPRRDLEYAQWKKLNEGIETGGGDVPEHVQNQIHTLVSKAFIPELAVATVGNATGSGETAGGPDAGGGHGPGDDSMGNVLAERPPRSNLLTPYAAAEGWAQMVGGGFPRPSGMTGVQTVTYRHVSSIFSEITHNTSGLPRSPLGAPGESALSAPASRGPAEATATHAVSKRDDFAWVSLCYTLLFFSAAPQTGAPYAFVELRKVCVANLDQESLIMSLVGAPESEDTEADLVAAGGAAAPADGDRSPSASNKAAAQTPVTIVLLLPDGRWQELNLQKLDLRVPTAGELAMWSTHLIAASQGRVARPSPPKPGGGGSRPSPRPDGGVEGEPGQATV